MHVSVIRWILANINFVILCTLEFFVVKVTLKSLLPTAVFLLAVLHACRGQHALLKGLSKQRVWHIAHAQMRKCVQYAQLVSCPVPTQLPQGLVSQKLSQNPWASSRSMEQPIISQSSVYWNNAEARTNPSIIDYHPNPQFYGQ